MSTHHKTAAQRLFEHAGDLLIVLDESGYFRAVNLAAEKALEYDSTALRSMTLEQLVIAEDRKRMLDFCHNVRNGEGPKSVEAELVRRNGERVRVEMVCQCATDEAGRKEIHIVARDVSGRRTVQMELRESEERYRRIVERSPEATIVLVEGRIAMLNDVAVRLFKAPGKKQLLGMTFEELVHADSEPTLSRYIRTMHDGGGSSPMLEERLLCVDGSMADAEVVAVPVRWSGMEAVHMILRDVTERRRAEKALKASEKKFRSFVENVFDAVYQSTPNGDMLMVNPAMVKLLGYDSEAELLRVNIARDLYADPNERGPMLRETEQKDERRNIELRLRRKDGRIITCLENTRVVRRANGDVMYYEGTLRDITDAKRVQEDLRKSEERYRAFITQSSEGIWCLELEQPLLVTLPVDEQVKQLVVRSYLKECNHAMARIFGHERPEDILGARMSDLFDMSESTGMETLRIYVRAGYRLSNFESTMTDPKGRNRYFLHNVIGIVEGGMLLRAWGMQRDITDRKEAELQLRESELRYRDFFDQDLAGHFISKRNGTLVACNSAFARILGYENVAEIMRVNADAFYPNPSARAAFMARLRTKGRMETIEVDLRRKDGKLIHVVENVHATFDAAGDILQIQGFLVDITEQKNLEQQLREAQKMETLGTLAGGVAHDFNNLLAIIRGYADLLKRESLLVEKGKKYLEPIETAVKRGAGIVRQLMTFAREDKQEAAPLDLNKTVEEVLQLAGVTIPENVRVEQHLEAGLPLFLGDVTQLHQALLNLVVNARDAMPHGGILRIVTSSVPGSYVRTKFPEAEAERYIRITVSDEGEGMNAETRLRIFEPFFTTKGVGKGSGLGLAVVYGVVRGHDGFVDVESNVKSGTDFFLYLPVSEQPLSAPVVPDVSTAATGGTETILIIEDEPMLLELLRVLLETSGYTVLSAADGEEALKIYKSRMKEIAVVLSDMGLPKLGGWEVFQKMKEINPKVRSILASGYLDHGLRADMLAAGAKDFIQKPYVPDKILLRIREVIDEPAS